MIGVRGRGAICRSAGSSPTCAGGNSNCPERSALRHTKCKPDLAVPRVVPPRGGSAGASWSGSGSWPGGCPRSRPAGFARRMLRPRSGQRRPSLFAREPETRPRCSPPFPGRGPGPPSGYLTSGRATRPPAEHLGREPDGPAASSPALFSFTNAPETRRRGSASAGTRGTTRCGPGPFWFGPTVGSRLTSPWLVGPRRCTGLSGRTPYSFLYPRMNSPAATCVFPAACPGGCRRCPAGRCRRLKAEGVPPVRGQFPVQVADHAQPVGPGCPGSNCAQYFRQKPGTEEANTIRHGRGRPRHRASPVGAAPSASGRPRPPRRRRAVAGRWASVSPSRKLPARTAAGCRPRTPRAFRPGWRERDVQTGPLRGVVAVRDVRGDGPPATPSRGPGSVHPAGGAYRVWTMAAVALEHQGPGWSCFSSASMVTVRIGIVGPRASPRSRPRALRVRVFSLMLRIDWSRSAPATYQTGRRDLGGPGTSPGSASRRTPRGRTGNQNPREQRRVSRRSRSGPHPGLVDEVAEVLGPTPVEVAEEQQPLVSRRAAPTGRSGWWGMPMSFALHERAGGSGSGSGRRTNVRVNSRARPGFMSMICEKLVLVDEVLLRDVSRR